MIGYAQQGGGAVPADFHWRSNPKQRQEELTDQELRVEAKAHHALPEVLLPSPCPRAPASLRGALVRRLTPPGDGIVPAR
jgi:hypothetical protein